jgi:molybdenum cofactor guanylyltransferase
VLAYLTAPGGVRAILEHLGLPLLPEDALRTVDAELRSVVSVNTPEGLARHGAALPSPGLRGNAGD